MGPVVNSPAWDSQPSFSSDGKTLFFASKREKGKGSSDIWKTELQPDGSWSEPVNLGDSINTPYEEMAPFIHPDNLTLYFSSRGHIGMGGFDLFYSRKNSDGAWTKPVNLGYPINTYADEITLVVNARGDLAYISSAGLGILLATQQRLKKGGKAIKLVHMNRMVRDVFKIARFDLIFEIE